MIAICRYVHKPGELVISVLNQRYTYYGVDEYNYRRLQRMIRHQQAGKKLAGKKLAGKIFNFLHVFARPDLFK